MSDVLVNLAVSAVVLAGLWLLLTALARAWGAPPDRTEEPAACSQTPPLPEGAADRVAGLAAGLARRVGCDPRTAAEAVEQELRYSPTAADVIILRRAEYWHRRNAPETCRPTYRRDAAPG